MAARVPGGSSLKLQFAIAAFFAFSPKVGYVTPRHSIITSPVRKCPFINITSWNKKRSMLKEDFAASCHCKGFTLFGLLIGWPRGFDFVKAILAVEKEVGQVFVTANLVAFRFVGPLHPDSIHEQRPTRFEPGTKLNAVIE